MRNLTLLILIICSSCTPFTGTRSGSRSSSDTVAEKQAADVVREGLTVPPIYVQAAKGSKVSVEVPAFEMKSAVKTAGSLQTESEEEKSWFSKKKLPLTLSLCFGAVGLIGLVIAVKMIRSSSAAANAAFSVADNGLAAGIHAVEAFQATATTDADNAKLATLKGLLEKHRGKL